VGVEDRLTDAARSRAPATDGPARSGPSGGASGRAASGVGLSGHCYGVVRRPFRGRPGVALGASGVRSFSGLASAPQPAGHHRAALPGLHQKQRLLGVRPRAGRKERAPARARRSPTTRPCVTGSAAATLLRAGSQAFQHRTLRSDRTGGGMSWRWRAAAFLVGPRSAATRSCSMLSAAGAAGAAGSRIFLCATVLSASGGVRGSAGGDRESDGTPGHGPTGSRVPPVRRRSSVTVVGKTV
jgi:hypothetical protein